MIYGKLGVNFLKIQFSGESTEFFLLTQEVLSLLEWQHLDIWLFSTAQYWYKIDCRQGNSAQLWWWTILALPHYSNDNLRTPLTKPPLSVPATTLSILTLGIHTYRILKKFPPAARILFSPFNLNLKMTGKLLLSSAADGVEQSPSNVICTF